MISYLISNLGGVRGFHFFASPPLMRLFQADKVLWLIAAPTLCQAAGAPLLVCHYPGATRTLC